MAQPSAAQAAPATDGGGVAQVKLSVSGVTKQFRLTSGELIQAVVDVSFDVLENELCLLLGPSGCGKSTVLRMVAGLEDPSAGRTVLDGHEITAPGRDRGMVFQSYTSFDWLTVQENVEYGLRLNGVPKAKRRERASHFIELVHLTKFRDAYPSQLSGGMKQRVAIARTLANDPAILLMDEPFGALDAETRWSMQELLMQIMEDSQTTVLMVTHDIEEAIFLADRIVFMTRHPGRVRETLMTDFKKGRRYDDKETVISLDGYAELDHHIMHMMREESPSRDRDTPAETAEP
jgi:ABC-type nitrate/sulfonate/bicarbonate transport system ATPase subunit